MKINKLRPFFTLLLLLMLASCAGIITDRTFITEMDRETDGFFVADRDFNIIAGDSGNPWRSREEINRRTPASLREKEENERDHSIKKELAKKVNALSPREYQYYRRVSSSFENDSERIYFLNLSPRERRNYFVDEVGKDREAASSKKDHFSFYRERKIASSEDRDLFLGMGKDEVIGTWGRPYRVDIAGDPRNENERWVFKGHRESKYVYFESGVVQGWSLSH